MSRRIQQKMVAEKMQGMEVGLSGLEPLTSTMST